ncbi:MAG: cytidine deaminase [Bdellovibrionaceae bacterium]|jgi:cytidine deaminase|nr:cytidine deaminase [Pseudobdellovibrionaceae bacterium]
MSSLQSLSSEVVKQLHQLAVQARTQSHSPYSGYAVGASVLFDDGHMESGTNIENASYGATVCAERVAIWSGVKDKKQRRLVAFCVVTDANPPWPPCGMCRQVASEFITEDAWVLLGNLEKVAQILRFQELFPSSFSPDKLLSGP